MGAHSVEEPFTPAGAVFGVGPLLEEPQNTREEE